MSHLDIPESTQTVRKLAAVNFGVGAGAGAGAGAGGAGH